jgi:hypothetical protein
MSEDDAKLLGKLEAQNEEILRTLKKNDKEAQNIWEAIDRQTRCISAQGTRVAKLENNWKWAAGLGAFIGTGVGWVISYLNGA